MQNKLDTILNYFPIILKFIQVFMLSKRRYFIFKQNICLQEMGYLTWSSCRTSGGL
jgi:hypothetical protein